MQTLPKPLMSFPTRTSEREARAMAAGQSNIGRIVLTCVDGRYAIYRDSEAFDGDPSVVAYYFRKQEVEL